jgi:hypothetical protein
LRSLASQENRARQRDLLTVRGRQSAGRIQDDQAARPGRLGVEGLAEQDVPVVAADAEGQGQRTQRGVQRFGKRGVQLPEVRDDEGCPGEPEVTRCR